jgi:PAS domain S-box-containing protein
MSNERFEMARSITNDAIWDWDITTDEAYLGENFKQLFGYDYGKERVSVSEWSKHIHPDDLQRVSKSLEDVFQSLSNNKWEIEYRYICADGTIAYVCDRAFLICDEYGKPFRMIGAMQNITEIVEYRMSLEQKVCERTKELNVALELQKEMVEAKNRFVSIASHEFRTPLSAIQFASGFLRKFHNRITGEDLERKLEGIEKQVVLMTALLDDMLVMGKYEAGKLKVNATTIDIIEFLEKITSDIVNNATITHTIVKKYDAPSLVLKSDEKLLRNIFINLITNAIKFSPGKDHINLNVEVLSNCVCIRVRDEGIGISQLDMASIFDPFQRGSNVVNIDGTGLGLSIVKKAVAVLGGEVSVSSNEGIGSEFTVKLPFA